jgi:hypothetical protein
MIIISRLFVWLDSISYLLNCCQSELCVIKCFRRWMKLLIKGPIEVERSPVIELEFLSFVY